MIKTEESIKSELAVALLGWYDIHKRSLPWREEPTPYHVWISEIMLQQTRVEAVRGYYARFLERFPDIRSLAEAEDDECLKLWEGLGYYSRARNLQKAAREIMSCYGGEMPRTASGLRKLSGIGPYTSAAIASIAYGEKIPAVDGNLLRIFSRLALYENEIRTPAAAAAAQSFFLELMPEERPGDFNQALMDLGSGVCVPGAGAACRSDASACPLSSFCQAFRQKRCASLPVMPVKKARRADKRTILIIRDGDRVMLRRRPAKGLLAGLYEFPNESGWLTADEAVGAARTYGCEPVRVTPLQESKHIFTHREWHMQGYEIWTGSFPGEGLAETAPERAGEPFYASLSELQERYAIPSAYAAYLSRLL